MYVCCAIGLEPAVVRVNPWVLWTLGKSAIEVPCAVCWGFRLRPWKLRDAWSWCCRFWMQWILVRSSVSCKDLHVSTQQSSLWEGLCHSYTAEIWQTQRGDEVEFPEREDGESAKQYFERLYERYIFFRDCDTVRCNRCNDWTSIGDDGLECEDCKGIWCDKCAIRGPSKHWLPCKDCPDFSKTHCLECFHDGKTLRCECHGTDSWSHCCGRHAFNCEKCNATLCRFCVNHHSYDCPEKDEEEEDELHPAN